MKQNLKCNLCSAVYYNQQADGEAYFHQCSPLPPDVLGHQAVRPGARDENLVLDPTQVILPNGQTVPIGAIPPGVTPVTFAYGPKFQGVGAAISATPPVVPT